MAELFRLVKYYNLPRFNPLALTKKEIAPAKMTNYKSGDDPEPVVLRSLTCGFCMTKFAGSLLHFPHPNGNFIGIAHFQARQLIHFQTCVVIFVCWMEEIDQATKKAKNLWHRDTYLH